MLALARAMRCGTVVCAALALVAADASAGTRQPATAYVFFNSFCLGCKQEAPDAAAWVVAHPAYRPVAVGFMERSAAGARRFEEAAGWRYPLRLDPRGQLGRRLGVSELISIIVVRGQSVIARYKPKARTTQSAQPGVRIVRTLNLSQLARAAGEPLLVEVGAPYWPEGRAAFSDFRAAAREAAAETRVSTVFLFCAHTKRQVTLLRSARLPVATIADTSPRCARDVRSAAHVNVAEEDSVAGRLFLPDGTLARLDYEWEIPLRKLGIDPTAARFAWMNLPVEGANYDITSLYANNVPAPDPALARGLACSTLPAVDNVQPTCDVQASLDELRALGKPLVVVGFAQYCPTCQQSTTEETYQAWADRHPDYTVVAITPDDPATAWLWAQRRGWHFLVLANGATELKGGYSDFDGFFAKVYKPLGLTWWGDHTGGDIPGDPFPDGF
jgi:peroxiredoxin